LTDPIHFLLSCLFPFIIKKATLAFKWLDAENYEIQSSAVYSSARGFYFTATQPKLVDDKMTLLSGVYFNGLSDPAIGRQPT